MNKMLILCAFMICTLRSFAAGSEIGELKWDRGNIDRLRSFSETEVLKFTDSQWGNTVDPVKSTDLIDFGWFDLAGNGKYELVSTWSFGPCCVFVDVDTRDTIGKVRQQSLQEAMGAGKLSGIVRDLNGDGKAELVLDKEFAEPQIWIPMAGTPRWPAVYRLEDGKYVEASRDFPNFYDTEILPKLNTEIGKALSPDNAAMLKLEKYKILRILGRDQTAGLKQAYEWMRSGDSQLLQCAVATFADIGGHDQEMREAQQAIPAAFKKELAARGGRS